MKYFTLSGDYLTAYHFCLKNGGQFFPGHGKDSANVCLIGQNCFTFWEENSRKKQEVAELAQFFGLDPEGQTGGRIARWVIDELIAIPYQNTFWNRTYRNLAKQGNHWHYLYCDSMKPFWGIEVDLKSAYFTSLFALPTFLFQPEKGYMEDGGALDNLKELYPHFPKWFRLQFLGCLASWRIFYFCRDKSRPESNELVKKHRNTIKYNAAFNVAHRAILRNYKIMKKIHEIGGEYIRRMHTDSFFIDHDIPEQVELALWRYVDSKNVRYTVKGFGRAFFWDINTGFIGNKFVGAKIDVVEKMRKDDVKMKSKEANEVAINRRSPFIDNSQNLAHSANIISGNNAGNPEQLELFVMEDYNGKHSDFSLSTTA
jgi:hypothetical protein